MSGLLAAAALAGAARLAAAGHDQPPPVTVVASFDAANRELPESITADNDGNVYATNFSGAVRLLHPDHTVSTVTTIALPPGGVLTGIKVGPDGLLYICSASFSASPDAAFIWRVHPDTGAFEQFASLAAAGFPNDLVFDDDGNLFVTDPALALIWKVDPAGNAVVWLADPLFAGSTTAPAFPPTPFGIDGIAFDRNKKTLIVSTLDFGRVMEIDIDKKHAPTISILVEDPALKGIDGIAIDRRGTIYAAVNTQNRIATIDRDGTISVLTEGPPLESPASFAFGTGHDDKKTLYVANFAIVNFLSGQPAHPGILSLPVQVRGLPLP
jgi:sugar lactone lactonase YvrE